MFVQTIGKEMDKKERSRDREEQKKEKNKEVILKKTFNSLNKEERRAYRTEFVNTYRTILLKYISPEALHEEEKRAEYIDYREEDTLHKDCIQEIAYKLRRLLSTEKQRYREEEERNNRNMMKDSKFVFGDAKIRVDCELEACMYITYNSDMHKQKGLYRESAPAYEVYKILQRIEEIRCVKRETKEEEGRDKEEVQREMIEEMKKYNPLTLAALFKIIVKKQAPIFPERYIGCYKKMSNVQDQHEKIVMSQFFMAFLIQNRKKELLEVVCYFLHMLVNKEESLLTFKNTAIIFTPLFFIDGTRSIVGCDFKHTLESLCKFLEFFLTNATEIMLIGEEVRVDTMEEQDINSDTTEVDYRKYSE